MLCQGSENLKFLLFQRDFIYTIIDPFAVTFNKFVFQR